MIRLIRCCFWVPQVHLFISVPTCTLRLQQEVNLLIGEYEKCSLFLNCIKCQSVFDLTMHMQLSRLPFFKRCKVKIFSIQKDAEVYEKRTRDTPSINFHNTIQVYIYWLISVYCISFYYYMFSLYDHLFN